MGYRSREGIWLQKMSHFYLGMRFWQSVIQNTKQNENNVSAMREKYYQDLEAMQEQYDVFIHDMRHTMRTIAALSQQGNCKEIERLIKELKISLAHIEQKMICSHKILNALLAERKSYADGNGILLEYDITEPLYFQNIEDNDLLSLIGNLLDNAIEAEKRSAKKDGILCSICLSKERRYMLIQIENSYTDDHDDRVKNKGQKAGIGEKHGIGLRSAQKIVRKYGGIMDSNKSDGRYRVKVILPVQSMIDEHSNVAGQKENTDVDAS